MQKRISVFGGSAPKPDQPAYAEARRLGDLLGRAGHTVLTGGYGGTMEAVSRGAFDAGGHVIGVTCDEIENWRGGQANPWVIEEVRFPALRERVYYLIDSCDAAIALPGGIGTLAELAAMWSTLQTSGKDTRPLILTGHGWQQTVRVMLEELGAYVSPAHRKLIAFAADVESAFRLI